MGGKGSGAHGNQGRNPVAVEKKKKHYNTRLEPGIIDRLKALAKIQGVPAAQIIQDAVVEYLDKNDN